MLRSSGDRRSHFIFYDDSTDRGSVHPPKNLKVDEMQFPPTVNSVIQTGYCKLSNIIHLLCSLQIYM